MFEKGNTYGKGRPPGSQNKTPNKDELIKLLDAIVKDFSLKFDELSNDDKLRILNAFRHLWRMEIENVFPVDNEIKIKIMERDEP
jgi:hypothetical protein